ncbi:MAG: hypothetical protein NZ480_04130 [Bdellovibrionaceae bacterium]|nr:hypothetical protein [Pseudobdellovibrionaceae bacterium]MDW8189947.1 hypothetical protein [Pseudobdellovibrionaceae bacterium]
MPSIKSRKKSRSFQNEPDLTAFQDQSTKSEQEKVRRPSHDDGVTEAQDRVHEGNLNHQQSSGPQEQVTSSEQMEFGAHSSHDFVSLNFPGKELLKKHFPKTYAFTEEMAQHWVKGDFEELPIEHPLLRLAVKTSLKKAKQIEGRIMESPVTEKVFTKAFEIGLDAQRQMTHLKNLFKKTSSSNS